MKNVLLQKVIIILFSLLSIHCYAQDEPLRVGVANYSPPFVMRSARNGFFGFDISMMNYVCKSIHRTCQYSSMSFDDLIPGVQAQKVNVAVSAITITLERLNLVNFSIPYLPGHSRFLGSVALSKQPFQVALLENKKVGVEKGTIFAVQIKQLGLKGIEIVEYRNENDQIAALSKQDIDFALMDSLGAVYWQNQSGNTLAVAGEPIPFGLGYGIAIAQNNVELTRSINQALTDYLKSPQYRQDYQTYIAGF